MLSISIPYFLECRKRKNKKSKFADGKAKKQEDSLGNFSKKRPDKLVESPK
jgi:hypothetical protein